MTTIVPLLFASSATDEQQLAATLASVRGELPDAPVLALRGELGDEGITSVTAEEALAAGEILAPIRVGDRWVPGSLEHRSLAFRKQPGSAIAAAAYERVDADGNVAVRISAPPPGTSTSELLLRPVLDASAVLLRSEFLTPERLAWLLQPFGDEALLAGLAHEHGLLPSGELAAQVTLDPARHGYATAIPRLTAAIDALPADAPGAATLRRELLRERWIEPLAPAGELDVAALLPADVRDRSDVAPVLDDVTWVLQRQAEALAAERLRWADGDLGGFEPIETITDSTLPNTETDLVGEIHRLHVELLRREAIIDRLTADVALRTGQLRRIEANA